MDLVGWLLDVYIEGNKAILWIKREDGKAVRLTDDYEPSFYIEPKDPSQIETIAYILSSHPDITHIEYEKKYTSLSLKKTDVLHIRVASLNGYKRVLEDLAANGDLKSYYNVDILHVQWYLFRKRISPTNKVHVSYNVQGEISSIDTVDDSSEIAPPPFKTLIFDLQISSESLSPDINSDPISVIKALDGNSEPVMTFSGTEREILTAFQLHIERMDPDILVAEDIEQNLIYILERARILGLNLPLGRENVDLSRLRRLLPYAHRGRVHVDLRTFESTGLAGITELARFTLAPIGLSAEWSAGKIIDSRQCYEALKRGILIPTSSRILRYVKTAKEVIFNDRGGLVFSPDIGLHENVGVLDFESMYPHIIVKHDLSYEAMTPGHVTTGRKGFLSSLTEWFLDRRLKLKHLQEEFPEGSQDRKWCEQRQRTLKNILVYVYGHFSSFSNRFNNAAYYEEISRLAREYLVKAMNISIANGFKVIYGDSDSLFVKKEDAVKDDFEALAKKITDETALPMVLERHFKFLVLLTQESDPNLEATRRYFGKLADGQLFYRGIELRRHDYPSFLKEFETKLMETLLDAESAEQVWETQYRKAFDYVVETCDLVRKGELSLDKLVITKVLRKPVDAYNSLFPHVAAAIQMAERGKKLRRNEEVRFVYVDADHLNPFKRVVPASVMDSIDQHYDREKYVELVLDVAETILGVFGFRRNQLGATRPRDYLDELRAERGEERLIELESLMGYFERDLE